MDIISYFLRWEDKYWGLFLAALFVFAFVAFSVYKDTDRRAAGRCLSASVYGLLGYLLLLCPLVYKDAVLAGFSDTEYERFFHIWIYPLILPAAGALIATLSCKKGEHKRAALLAAGFLMLFFVAGDMALVSPKASYISADLVGGKMQESYEMILEDAAKQNVQPRIWGPSEWMAKSRMYDSALLPSYGKDIAGAPEKYSETQRLMKNGYDSFENAESPRVNMEDQIGAIANLPNVLADAPVSYVAMIDPASLESDIQVDADAVFAACGYTYLGSAGDLRIYRYNNGEAR